VVAVGAGVRVAGWCCGWGRGSRTAWLRYPVAGAARQPRFRSGGRWRGSAGGAPEPRLRERPSCGQARPGRAAGAPGSVRAGAGPGRWLPVVRGLKSGSRTATAAGLVPVAGGTPFYLPEPWMITQSKAIEFRAVGGAVRSGLVARRARIDLVSRAIRPVEVSVCATGPKRPGLERHKDNTTLSLGGPKAVPAAAAIDRRPPAGAAKAAKRA